MEYRFLPIEIGQKSAVEKILRTYGRQDMAHAFGTLFLWKETMGLTLCLGDDFFAVRAMRDGEEAYFFPCGNEVPVRRFIEDFILPERKKLIYVAENDRKFLAEHFAEACRIEADPGSSEYLYDKKKHLSMTGPDYRKLRNEQQALLREHTVRVENLTEENRRFAAGIVEDWKLYHGVDGAGEADVYVAGSVLRCFEALDCVGVLVFVDGEPWAVGAATPLTEETYCMQLAKTRTPLPGLSTYLWQQVMAATPETCRVINGDDDMDLPGLRLYKRKLIPDGMNEMYTAYGITR